MLLQPQYNRELYDLYLYDQTATRDRVPNPDYDPGCLDIPDQECEPETIITSTQGTPIAFNPNHWTKIYNDDMDLDFTGSMLITRRFNNITNQCPPGTRAAQLRSKILNTFPTDINWYNAGWWRAVLISPKHILCCQHMARHGGYSRNQRDREASFMNKSGEIFTTKFKEISAAEWRGPLTGADGQDYGDFSDDYITGNEMASDTALLELEDEVPTDFGIKIYNKAPIRSTIPKNALVFLKDNQGRVIQFNASAFNALKEDSGPTVKGMWKYEPGIRNNPNNPDESFRVGLAVPPFGGDYLGTDTWIIDGEEYDLTGMGNSTWSGDSGTEIYWYSPTHGTVFGGQIEGGPHPPMWDIESGSEFINYLNEEHLIPNGYEPITPVDMSDAVTRQKIKISRENNFTTDATYSRTKFDVVSKITKPNGSVVEVPSNIITGASEGEEPKIEFVKGTEGYTYTNAGLIVSYEQMSNKGGGGIPGSPPIGLPPMLISSEFLYDDEGTGPEEGPLSRGFAVDGSAGDYVIVPDRFVGSEMKVISSLTNTIGTTSETLSFGTVKPRGYSASASNISFTPDPPVRGQDVTINASMDGDPYWDTTWLMVSMGGGFATAETRINRFYTFPRTVRLPDSDEIVGDPLFISITAKNPYNFGENNQFTAQSQNITED